MLDIQVAVRYNSDVHSIKRANNLISDHALASRQRVFVPGALTEFTVFTFLALICHLDQDLPASALASASIKRDMMFAHAVKDAEDRIGRAVTIKWCPIVCREYAVLDASSDATCFADFGSKAKPHDDAALAKLTNLLSRGEEEHNP